MWQVVTLDVKSTSLSPVYNVHFIHVFSVINICSFLYLRDTATD